MLSFMLGRAGSGKTGRIMEIIGRRVAQGLGRNILIVPEQYSHEAERELLRSCGESTSLYAEVLSFTRLAHTVARELGGSARSYTDAGGRALQMTLALDAAAAGLSVYGGARRQPEAIGQLLSVMDELRAGCVTGEALRAAAGQTGPQLGAKLRDLALLQDALHAVEAAGDADTASRLDLLASEVKDSALLRGSCIFIDGFTDFTAQERRVIRELWLVGDVTICLSCDDPDGNSEEFALARRSIHTLRRAAREDGVEAEIVMLPSPEEESAMDFVERCLFRYTPEHFDAAGAVRICSAANPAAECELAAGEVLRLVRETGCRWRDIAVAVRNFSDYQGLLESSFERCGIPLYTSRRSDIMQKPLPCLITSAFEVIGGGWAYEDMFAYLKTGLTGLSREDCDELENYVLLWDIRGRAWTAEKPWRQHPEGYNHSLDAAAAQRLAHIDALRRRVAAPLQQLREAGRAASTAAGQCRALADFWAQLELPVQLEKRAEELRRWGEMQADAEALQLWEKLVGALEQCARVLGDMVMGQEEFARLFRLVISQYDVGTIPVAVDRVVAGDFDRMRRRRLRHLLVLGATDSRIPWLPVSAGVFTPAERETLRTLQLEVEDDDDRLEREYSLIYNVFSLPAESLYVSRPLSDTDGSESRPSFVAERLARLFSLEEEPGSREAARAAHRRGALELAVGGNEEARAFFAGDEEALSDIERLQAAARQARGRLGAESVRALYGAETWLTASKVDTFASCKFQYFLRYGLRAKPREPAGFNPPELGTFFHYVLEGVARSVGEQGGFAAVNDEQVRQCARHWVKQYVHEELEDFREKSARFVYLFRRLVTTVESVVLDTAAELRRSDFVPLDFELNFSETRDMPPLRMGDGETALVLTGVADRVDGWEKDGKLYLRVVDYKTGAKSFSLSDVWYGMNLQMLLYLFALAETGERHYGKKPLPAGVLYVPARDRLYSSASRPTDEEILKEKLKTRRRSGLLLSDEDVLQAMEHGEDGCMYLPVKLNRSGAYSGDALASAEQLGRLSEHIRQLLCGMAGELRRGSINADPWYRSETESTCLWCSYYDACHFDENRDEPRYKVKLKAPEFWARLEERRDG